MRWCVALVASLAAAPPAAAQSTYVGASLVADVARFSGVDMDDTGSGLDFGAPPRGDGETLGFNVKVGRALGRQWGVELEFARSGEFESRSNIGVPLVRERLDMRVPSFEYESERSHTTLAALAWVRHDVGRRVDLSYFGGIAFTRVDSEQDFTGPVIQIFPPVTVPGYETVVYDVGPSVGVEAAVNFGAAAVTGGVRLQTIGGTSGGGWLIRPNAGMRWTF